MNGLKKTVGWLLSLLAISEIPIKDGKTNFSDEQAQKLKDKLGEELTKQTIDAIEKETARVAAMQEENTELQEIRNELAEALKDTNLTEEEVVKSVKAKSGSDELSLSAEVAKLTKELIAHNKKQDVLIQKLISEPENDSPDASGQINPNGKVKHSKTHLFATGKDYDSFDGRPWNRHAAEGKTDKLTDWMSSTGVEVQKLNGDLDLFYRENPEAIRSLHRDNFGLPAFWPKKTKVVDQVSDGTIVSDEISQARKLPWLPKNNQAIEPETGKIFPIQIDIEFVGKFLQDLEASWLSKFVGGGSSPYKDSFVRFLVSELDKKARQEDRMATIKGVYVKTPDNATVPGRAINRQDGLLILLWRAYFLDQKYKVANIGAPTKQNIVDYIPKLIEANLKEEVRNVPNLVCYWSPDWERAYKIRYRQIHGLETDFDGDVLHVENYPNIRFVKLPDFAGTDFMLMTFDDNIQILENIPAEKSLYRFEKLLRYIYVLGDYKLGVRLIHIGNKVKDGDPDAFKVQTVWTNGMPMFKSDFFVPVYDDKTGEVSAAYKNLQVDASWDTDITKIKGTYAGEVIKIKGNTSMTNAKVVKDAGDLDLTADFNLKSGGTLTLVVQSDLKLKELKRTAAPETVAEPVINFDTAVIDAADGSDQNWTGSSATTVTDILNGVEGQQLTITWTASAAALTINDVSGNVDVASTAVLDAATDTISFVFVDGVWMETSRAITE